MKKFKGIRNGNSNEWVYVPQPKQQEFHDMIVNRDTLGITNILFGGAAGGGKSMALRWQGHSDCISYPGIRGLLIRSSFPELSRSHLAIDKIHSDFKSSRVFRFNWQKHEATYANGSVFEFGYGSSESDFEKYLSAEYDFIMIDELTTIPFRLALLLFSRCRGRMKEFSPYVACASNPGSISHAEVKSYYVDKDFTVKFPELGSEYDESQVGFIPATVYDNPIVLERDPKYVQRLASLPSRERKRFLEGNWDIYEGQFFDKLSREVHLCDPFDIPDNWIVNGSMDYGNTSCSHIIRISPLTGHLYVTNEWTYEKGTTEEKRRDYYDWLSKLGLINKRFTVWHDTNMGAVQHELQEKRSPADKFKSYFCTTDITWRPVSKKGSVNRRYRVFANNELKDVINWKKDYNGNWIKEPRLKIFKTCRRLFDTMSALIVDKNDNEDWDMHQDIDHWTDSLKYNIMSIKHPSQNEYIPMLRQQFARNMKNEIC